MHIKTYLFVLKNSLLLGDQSVKIHIEISLTPIA